MMRIHILVSINKSKNYTCVSKTYLSNAVQEIYR